MSETMEHGMNPGADFFDDGSSGSEWEDSEGDLTQSLPVVEGLGLGSLVHEIGSGHDRVSRGRSRERDGITALPSYHALPAQIDSGLGISSPADSKGTPRARPISLKRLGREDVQVVHNRSSSGTPRSVGTPRDSLRSNDSDAASPVVKLRTPFQVTRPEQAAVRPRGNSYQGHHRRNTSESMLADSIINAHVSTMRALEALNVSPTRRASDPPNHSFFHSTASSDFPRYTSFTSSRHITMTPLSTMDHDRPAHLPGHFVKTPYPFTAKKEFPKPKQRPRQRELARLDSGYDDEVQQDFDAKKGKHVLGLPTSGGDIDLRSRLERNEDAQGVIRSRADSGIESRESVVWLSLQRRTRVRTHGTSTDRKLVRIDIPSSLTISSPDQTGRKGKATSDIEFDDKVFAERLRAGHTQLAGNWFSRTFSARTLQYIQLGQTSVWSGVAAQDSGFEVSGLLAVGEGMDSSSESRSPFTEDALSKLYRSPKTGRARYTWVHWARRVAASNHAMDSLPSCGYIAAHSSRRRARSLDSTSRLGEKADLGPFSDDAAIPISPSDTMTTIQFVHLISVRRILVALTLMLALSVLVPVLWITLGVRGSGWRVDERLQRSDRVGPAMAIGILTLLLEGMGFGAWLWLSYLIKYIPSPSIPYLAIARCSQCYDASPRPLVMGVSSSQPENPNALPGMPFPTAPSARVSPRYYSPSRDDAAASQQLLSESSMLARTRRKSNGTRVSVPTRKSQRKEAMKMRQLESFDLSTPNAPVDETEDHHAIVQVPDSQREPIVDTSPLSPPTYNTAMPASAHKLHRMSRKITRQEENGASENLPESEADHSQITEGGLASAIHKSKTRRSLRITEGGETSSSQKRQRKLRQSNHSHFEEPISDDGRNLSKGSTHAVPQTPGKPLRSAKRAARRRQSKGKAVAIEPISGSKMMRIISKNSQRRPSEQEAPQFCRTGSLRLKHQNKETYDWQVSPSKNDEANSGVAAFNELDLESTPERWQSGESSEDDSGDQGSDGQDIDEHELGMQGVDGQADGDTVFQEDEDAEYPQAGVAEEPDMNVQDVDGQNGNSLDMHDQQDGGHADATAIEEALRNGVDLPIRPDVRTEGEFTADEKELIRRAIWHYQEVKDWEVQDLAAVIQWTPDDLSGDVNKQSEQDVNESDDWEDMQESRDFWNEMNQSLIISGKIPRDLDAVRAQVCAHYHIFKRGDWTDDDDNELLKYYQSHPGQWNIIETLMNRPRTDIRSRWDNLRRRQMESGTCIDTKEAQLVGAVDPVARKDGKSPSVQDDSIREVCMAENVDSPQVVVEVDDTRDCPQVGVKCKPTVARDESQGIEDQTKPRGSRAEPSLPPTPQPRLCIQSDSVEETRQLTLRPAEHQVKTVSATPPSRQPSSKSIDDTHGVAKMLWGDKFDLIEAIMQHRCSQEASIDWGAIVATMRQTWSTKTLQVALGEMLDVVKRDEQPGGKTSFEDRLFAVLDFLEEEHGDEVHEHYNASDDLKASLGDEEGGGGGGGEGEEAVLRKRKTQRKRKMAARESPSEQQPPCQETKQKKQKKQKVTLYDVDSTSRRIVKPKSSVAPRFDTKQVIADSDEAESEQEL
ncbi:hypothetical protein T440DRAFT_483391 [Plenodomus tracheiphilus IPT5]|uniref:Uncharacterized protein n=1 Tax=Plenodomus tracheiphilus IPT5 TaxID=1408161 RepID=A0A6A7AQ26_9PLEO|nr:hypothetical protein T440DRAFT_483391 [Plenodomus tracheiphilus IPT5]